MKKMLLLIGLVFLLIPVMAGASGLTAVISPADTSIELGEELQFGAVVLNEANESVDTTLTWSLSEEIATIDSNGFFISTDIGLTYVQLFTGETCLGKVAVYIKDSASDSTGIQTISIVQHKPNGNAKTDTTIINEGDFWEIGGLKFPYNVLNGGLLIFPTGSLHENILLDIALPEYVDTTSSVDTVYYPESILAAIKFDVYVDDTLQSPYYFDTPALMALPFKRGLLRQLNLNPEDLGMYFLPEDSVEVVVDGISAVVVDSVLNRIFGYIPHFSNIVLTEAKTITDISDNKLTAPSEYALSRNYPNPFNPTTTFSFSLPEQANVTITIYNMLGKEVAILMNTAVSAGSYTLSWNGMDSFGRQVSSGVYFYEISTTNFRDVKKMMFLK